MRIIFVRHGHPNYELDCLTPLGHRHAAAAALRLQDEGIEKIFSSTCGRAWETASHTAKALSLPVEECPFMREIGWGTKEGAPLFRDGHPWDTADQMVLANLPLYQPDQLLQEPHCRNIARDYVEKIAADSDAFLESLGFQREGHYYRCLGQRYETVAAFGHGGASAAQFSRIMNLPFLYVCCCMPINYTGITVISLENKPGQLVTPKVELYNDARHIQNMQTQNIFNR